MFDDIRCEYPLPLPEDQGELAGKDWLQNGFQTKDLGEGMGVYCIRADGTLWLVKGRWLADDPEGETFQKDFSGTVEFYGTVYCLKHDYRVEWQAMFTQGKLNELLLREWQLEDNTKRLREKAEREIKEARTKRFLETWTGRFLYPPYAWLIGILLREIVANGAYKLSNLLTKVRSQTWRLESYMKPHGDPLRLRSRRKKMNNLP